jgi:hypothetical protein
MIETIRYLWQSARCDMGERKTARTLDREIHRLQRLEDYALRRHAILKNDHDELAEGIEHLRRARALMPYPAHPIRELIGQIMRRQPADDATPQ